MDETNYTDTDVKRIGKIDANASLSDVLLWSDNEADKLQALVNAENEWYNQNITGFAHDWHRDVFNLNTLNAFGVSVWARILGIELTMNFIGDDNQPTFGFKVEGDTQIFENFDHGNYTSRTGFNVNLNLDQSRLLIKLRYLKLISRPSVPSINRMLKIAFGPGQAHVIDPYNMSDVIYVFRTEPGDIVRLMVQYFDLLPRPSCVGVEIRVVGETPFGFSDVNENYDNGNFVNEAQ